MVASKLFTDADRAAIHDAVADAERRTSGEIVPVVASASDDYERAEDTFGLWLSLLLLAGAWFLFQDAGPSDDAWGARWEIRLGLLPVLGIVTGGWILGILLARRVPAFKRAAASRSDMEGRVVQAAEDAFRTFHVRGTKAATGIVLYVSLFERIVCIRGDEAISAKVGAEDWRGICDGLTRALREGRARDGMVEAIRRCGDLLAAHFPPPPGDVNELVNDLRIID